MKNELVGSPNQSPSEGFRMRKQTQRPLSPLAYESVYENLINYDITKAVRIVDQQAWTEAAPFLNPHATQTVNLVHFAACRGHQWILNQAIHYKAQFLATDEYGRCALHHAAHQGHLHVLEALGTLAASVQTRGPELALHPQLNLADRDGRTALHDAVMGKHVMVVRLLVDAGANVNARDAMNHTPFLLAHFNVDRNEPEQMRRYEDIVEILVSAEANRIHPDTGDETVLHQAVRLNSRRATERLLESGSRITLKDGLKRMTTPVHDAARFGYHKTLSILLEHLHPSDIDVTDKRGWSALHYAAAFGTLDCVQVLVNKGGDLAKKIPSGDTVLDLLGMFKHDADLVAYFADILDAKVGVVDNSNSPAQVVYEINLDFRMLAPCRQPQMAVVSALIDALPRMEQIAILQHPVLMTYIYTKWSRVRYLFYSLVLIHVLFVFFLTVYVVVVLHAEDDSVYLRRTLLFFTCIPFCLTVLYFMAEPKRCAKQFGHWSYLICLMISIGIAVAGEFPNKSMEEQPAEKHCHWRLPWIMHSVSIAILLAWIKMMLLAGQFPAWGFYALIFSTVLRNVLKVFFIGIWIIAGFTLSFSVLFHGHDQFANPLKAFVKTVIMFMGEYDFDDLVSTNETDASSHNCDSYEDRYTLLPITSRIVFLLFVMLASIVLMNLMIGLAVSDIQGLVKQGRFSRFRKQVKFIARCEQLASHKVFQSRLVPIWLTEMMKSTIDVEKNLRWHWGRRGQPEVSRELGEDLLKLTSKNRERDSKLEQSISSHAATSTSNLYVAGPEAVSGVENTEEPTSPIYEDIPEEETYDIVCDIGTSDTPTTEPIQCRRARSPLDLPVRQLDSIRTYHFIEDDPIFPIQDEVLYSI